jgi:uncharacterized protein YecE (DUF72 family)
LRTSRADWLRWYSRTFNLVEGNSTFYALPSLATFQKWAEQSVTGFQFCFKFPKEITHDLQLRHCQTATREFLDRLDVLSSYLQSLPREFPWAVEVRHEGWFDAEAKQSDAESNEKRLDELLQRLQIDKVLFDSRALFQCPADDAIEIESQKRKPKTPLRRTVTSQRPMLRIVGRNRVEMTDIYFAEWAPVIANWIRDGLNPIVFTHAPDDAKAPELARRFLGILQTHLPQFNLTLPRPPQPSIQLSFFDDESRP